MRHAQPCLAVASLVAALSSLPASAQLLDSLPLDGPATAYHRGMQAVHHVDFGFLAGGEVLDELLDDWAAKASDAAPYLQELDQLRPLLLESLRAELRLFPSNRAAWMLGYYRDRQSLPWLKRYFLEADDYFYGWESSVDASPLEAQYKWLHVLEQAIGHITGQPIEQAVRLTAVESAKLEVANTDAALYVLSRLDPAAAFRAAARQLRWDFSSGFDTWILLKAGALGQGSTMLPNAGGGGHLGLAVLESLPVTTTREEIDRRLGPTLESTPGAVTYDLGCAKRCLKLKLQYAGSRRVGSEAVWCERDEI